MKNGNNECKSGRKWQKSVINGRNGNKRQLKVQKLQKIVRNRNKWQKMLENGKNGYEWQ